MPDHVFAPGGLQLRRPPGAGSSAIYWMTPSWSVANETTGVFEVISMRLINNSNVNSRAQVFITTGLSGNTSYDAAQSGGNSQADVAPLFNIIVPRGQIVELTDKNTPLYFKAYDYNESPGSTMAINNTAIVLFCTNEDGGSSTGFIVLQVYYKYYLNRENSTSTESQGLFRFAL